MQYKECLVLIGRFLSQTNPIEASLINRSCYNDVLIHSRLSEYKRRLIYKLLQKIYARKWLTTVVWCGIAQYVHLHPVFSALLSFDEINIVLSTDRYQKVRIKNEEGASPANNQWVVSGDNTYFRIARI